MQIREINDQKHCFILLPGFAPSPEPILPLKELLEKTGHEVIVTNFWGDEPINDFSEITIEKCLVGIKAIVERTKVEGRLLVGIGTSLGGALLIEYSKTYSDFDHLVSIGTPFRLKRKLFSVIVLKILPYFYPIWRQAQKIKCLQLAPLGSARVVVDFLRGRFLSGLEKVQTPVILVHSKRDKITDYTAVSEFAEKFSKQPKVIYFENGDHVINYNWELILHGMVANTGIRVADIGCSD